MPWVRCGVVANTEKTTCWQSAIGAVWSWLASTAKIHRISRDQYWEYGFPSERAAAIAVETVRTHADSCEVEVVKFVCFDKNTYSIYESLLHGN